MSLKIFSYTIKSTAHQETFEVSITIYDIYYVVKIVYIYYKSGSIQPKPPLLNYFWKSNIHKVAKGPHTVHTEIIDINKITLGQMNL